MKKIIYSLAALCMLTALSGCINTEKAVPTPTADLTLMTTKNPDGSETHVVTALDTKIVQGKTAVITANVSFDAIETSTLTIEKGIVEVKNVLRDSTIIVKNGSVLKVPYIKNSTITVEKGGDLQIKERMKESKIILKNGNFSIKPGDIDEKSSVVQE